MLLQVIILGRQRGWPITAGSPLAQNHEDTAVKEDINSSMAFLATFGGDVQHGFLANEFKWNQISLSYSASVRLKDPCVRMWSKHNVT